MTQTKRSFPTITSVNYTKTQTHDSSGDTRQEIEDATISVEFVGSPVFNHGKTIDLDITFDNYGVEINTGDDHINLSYHTLQRLAQTKDNIVGSGIFKQMTDVREDNWRLRTQVDSLKRTIEDLEGDLIANLPEMKYSDESTLQDDEEESNDELDTVTLADEDVDDSMSANPETREEVTDEDELTLAPTDEPCWLYD